MRLLLPLLLTAATRLASAQSHPTARLVYEGHAIHDRCPDELTLRNAISARLGYDPFRVDAPTTVVATLTRAGRQLRAHIEVREAGQPDALTRDLSSSRNDCSELASAMALAISIAIDPLSLARPPAPRPPPESSAPAVGSEPPASVPSPPPPTALPATTPPAPTEERSHGEIAHRVILRASLGGVGTIGTAHDGVGGGVFEIGLWWRFLAVGIGLRADAASGFRLGAGDVATQFTFGTLTLCGRYEIARVNVLVCALGALGGLHGTGNTTPHQTTAESPFGALGGRVEIDVRVVGPVSFRSNVDVFATLPPTTVHFGPAAWSPSPAGASLGLGIAVRFP